MIVEHYRAVRALIPERVNVYMFEAVGAPKYPYVVLWGGLGDERSGDVNGDSLDDEARSWAGRVRATYVGLTWDSMMIVARNVRAALSGARPVVEGRVCSRLRQAALEDGQVDRDVTVNSAHPVYAVDEFSFVSDPA